MTWSKLLLHVIVSLSHHCGGTLSRPFWTSLRFIRVCGHAYAQPSQGPAAAFQSSSSLKFKTLWQLNSFLFQPFCRFAGVLEVIVLQHDPVWPELYASGGWYHVCLRNILGHGEDHCWFSQPVSYGCSSLMPFHWTPPFVPQYTYTWRKSIDLNMSNSAMTGFIIVTFSLVDPLGHTPKQQINLWFSRQ